MAWLTKGSSKIGNRGMFADFKSQSAVMIGTLIALPAHVASAEDGKQWICVAEAATGFAFHNDKWQRVTFNIDGEKYIISQTEPKQSHILTYRITQLGKKTSGSCQSIKYPPFPTISCNYSLTEIKVNVKSLRFIAVYPIGYIDGKDTNDNTPSMTIGKCSPL